MDPDTLRALMLEGFRLHCTLPAELGNITGLRIKNGRVIAETESGILFVVSDEPTKPPTTPTS